MFFRLNKMVILSFIALFSLFISSVSFGGPNEDLLLAIGKNNIDDARKILQTGGVDFQKIDRFFTKGAKQGKLDDFDRANCIKLLNLVFGNSVFSSNDDHKINIDLVG